MKPHPVLRGKTTDVLCAIYDSLQWHGRPPTLRELAGVTGIASTNGVRYHLKRLIKHGLIEHDPLVTRGLRLTDKSMRAIRRMGESHRS